MGKDQEGYVWVLFTRCGEKVSAHSVYTTYAALQEEIDFIECQITGGSEVYDYEQVPLF